MTVEGMVQKGQQRGKDLGFPTINIPLLEQLPEGIYVSHIVIEEKQYNALTFIGAAKTFDEKIYQAETYVFDFDKDVYGQKVRITLLKKLRDNQKFVSAEALIKQMEIDKKQAQNYFAM
jgi:riboflavin kinase/FMN adenylyltransferase